MRKIVSMRRVLACAVVTALAVSGTALADHLDPQRKITKADQARARAMLLKKRDFGAGVQTNPTGPEQHVTCAGVNLPDLTLTGEAESPAFATQSAQYASASEVYRSVADAKASWRVQGSRAGTACTESLLRRGYAKQGLTLESFGRRAFPRVASATAAFRARFSATVQGRPISVTLDAVVLYHSRAQLALVFASRDPLPQAAQLALVRKLGQRMTRVMRGA